MVDTLPAPVRKVAAGILRHVENAIYSDERLPFASEKEQLAEVLGGGPGDGELKVNSNGTRSMVYFAWFLEVKAKIESCHLYRPVL